jgi:hypothetical protein
MRCKACNTILEDSELTKKDERGDFYDLCRICLGSVYKSELYEDNFYSDLDNLFLQNEGF